MLGTSFGSMDRFSLGTYYVTEINCKFGTSDGKFEVLLLGDSLVSLG